LCPGGSERLGRLFRLCAPAGWTRLR
jgi:hypothetical protein